MFRVHVQVIFQWNIWAISKRQQEDNNISNYRFNEDSIKNIEAFLFAIQHSLKKEKKKKQDINALFSIFNTFYAEFVGIMS